MTEPHPDYNTLEKAINKAMEVIHSPEHREELFLLREQVRQSPSLKAHFIKGATQTETNNNADKAIRLAIEYRLHGNRLDFFLYCSPNYTFRFISKSLKSMETTMAQEDSQVGRLKKGRKPGNDDESPRL